MNFDLQAVVDTLQMLLVSPWYLFFPIFFVLITLLRSGRKIIFQILGFLITFIWKSFKKVWNGGFSIIDMYMWRKWFFSLLLTGVIFYFREELFYQIEMFDQKTVRETFQISLMLPTDTNRIQEQNAYIWKLSKYADSYERKILLDSAEVLQREFGLQRVDFLQSLLNECGLDPFELLYKENEKGEKYVVAAGHLQFTRVGLDRVVNMYTGKLFTMPEIIQACRDKNVSLLAHAYNQYVRVQWATFGKPDLSKQYALYRLLFCPTGFTNSDYKDIIYSLKRDGNKYSQNAGMDGYYLDEKGRIIYDKKKKDDALSWVEIVLRLESKKSRLVKEYMKNN